MTDSQARFWDRIAKKYATRPVPDEAIYQTKLEATRRYLRPGMKVLEFGCGTGTTALKHAPLVGQVDAIDFSERMIEICRSKAEAAGATNVSFRQAGIDTFEAPARSYDVVLGLNVLHLMRDKDAVNAKVFRMLKPGGAYVTSTACLGDNVAFFKYIAPLGRSVGLLPHLDVMTKKELIASLNEAGFVIDHDWAPKKGQAFLVALKAA